MSESHTQQKTRRGPIATTRDLARLKQQLMLEFHRMICRHTEGKKKEFLKTSEVQELLNISPGKLQAMRESGQIAYSKLEGVIIYEREEIDKLIERTKVSAK